MRSARLRHRAAAAGFTLIEILMALMVFLSGVVGLYALLTTGLALQGDGVELARATGRLDAVVYRLTQELAAGEHRGEDGWLDVQDSLADGTLYAVELRDAGEGPESGLVIARVRVASGPRQLVSAPVVEYVVFVGDAPSVSGASSP